MVENNDVLNQEEQHFAGAGRVYYFDVVLDSGKGAILKDVAGNEYIDLLASASATNTGHAHPKIVKAIQDQAEKLVHYTAAYFATSTEAKLASELVKLAPGDEKDWMVVFGNSGSDANDAVIKFARGYTGRTNVVSFVGAYHGSTYGSISASAVSLNMSRKIGPLLPGFYKVPFPSPDKRLPGENDEAFSERMFAAFKEPFENYLPAEETAVIMIEAIQGDGGIMAPPAGYWQKVADFAHDHGILLAVDEVNQGYGRTGKFWAFEHFGIHPDLIAMGKSMASGLPLSAVLGRREIMQSLDAPANVYTTAGNVISAASALTTLDVIKSEKLVERSAELGKFAKQFFEKEQATFDFIGDVRLYGLNGGIDIIDPETGLGDEQGTNTIIYNLFKNGVLMISLRGNTLRFQPPLVIKKEELQQAFDVIHKVFAGYQAGELLEPNGRHHIGW